MPEKKPRSRSQSKKVSQLGKQSGAQRGRRRQKAPAAVANYGEPGIVTDDVARDHGSPVEIASQVSDVALTADVAPEQPRPSEEQHRQSDPHWSDQEHRGAVVDYREPEAVTDDGDRDHGSPVEVASQVSDVAPEQPQPSEEQYRQPDLHWPHQEHRDAVADDKKPGAVTDDVDHGDHGDRAEAERQMTDVASSAYVAPEPRQRVEDQFSPRTRHRRVRRSGVPRHRATFTEPVLWFFKREWREMKAGWARLAVVGLTFLGFGYWIRGQQSTQGDNGIAQAELEPLPSLPSVNGEIIENQISFPNAKTADSTKEEKQGVMEDAAAGNAARASSTENAAVVEARNSTVTNLPRTNPIPQSNAVMQEYFIHQRAWVHLPESERAERQKAFNELEARIRAARSGLERKALMDELHELP